MSCVFFRWVASGGCLRCDGMQVQFVFFVQRAYGRARITHTVSSTLKHYLTHARSVFSLYCLIHANKSLLCTPTHLITHKSWYSHAHKLSYPRLHSSTYPARHPTSSHALFTPTHAHIYSHIASNPPHRIPAFPNHAYALSTPARHPTSSHALFTPTHTHI